MISVSLPEGHRPEKTYIISLFLGEFLGLPFTITKDPSIHYKLTLPNHHQLIIEDAFFKNYKTSLSYLTVDALPQKVTKKDLICLYGTPEIISEPTQITCKNDLIAGSFFMLTRWEEYVNQRRDSLGRFSAKDSMAYQHKFLEIPIVNEYIEFVWKSLVTLGYTHSRKQRTYQMILTHDVDNPYKWDSPIQGAAQIIGDVLKRHSLTSALRNIQSFINTKYRGHRDPYDTFDLCMRISESQHCKSEFYFMGGGTTRYDNYYNITSPNIKKLIHSIQERGHIIGFHPSFSTPQNITQFQIEKKAVESAAGHPVTIGRQHFLRFEPPHTWQIWEDSGMKVDSSLSYYDHAGFRCGICYEYPVFNFLTQQPLSLKERPLTAMECSFITYNAQNPSEMKASLHSLISTVKKYQGIFVMLWHNSALFDPPWNTYSHLYEILFDL